MAEQIFAYTSAGPALPGYVAVSQEDGGDLRLVVRGEGRQDTSELTIPKGEVWKLSAATQKALSNVWSHE